MVEDGRLRCAVEALQLARGVSVDVLDPSVEHKERDERDERERQHSHDHDDHTEHHKEQRQRSRHLRGERLVDGLHVGGEQIEQAAGERRVEERERRAEQCLEHAPMDARRRFQAAVRRQDAEGENQNARQHAEAEVHPQVIRQAVAARLRAPAAQPPVQDDRLHVEAYAEQDDQEAHAVADHSPVPGVRAPSHCPGLLLLRRNKRAVFLAAAFFLAVANTLPLRRCLGRRFRRRRL